MKHTLARRTLLFFSIIAFQILFQSCKIETKNEFSIEETRAIEQRHIMRLLDKAKLQIENEELAEAIKTLDSIINGYGTYEEVEDAYSLKEDAQNRYILNRILTLNNIDSLLIFITDYDNENIKTHAESRIEEVLTTTQDPKTLQDFISSYRLPQFRTEAKQRQKELLQKKEDELYAKATQENNPQTWKGFLEMYPEHSKRKQIEENIIELEVDEIFKGTYGEIPTSNQIGVANYTSSSVEITNNTEYTLTIRYSGPENKRLIISPGALQKLDLKSGDYRVTASVNAARVDNFAGRESLKGTYNSSYYISY